VSNDLEIDLPPFAPVLLESMRAIGYSFEAAIADIVDNSVSATASAVQIWFSPYGSPYVAIVDDGQGMTDDELIAAMRYGSRTPLQARAKDDLGRFGLGLKTASLSQCRRLTVVSIKDAVMAVRRWDLDVIHRKQRWTLLGLTPEQIDSLPRIAEFRALKSGTMVVWQDFDRFGVLPSQLEQTIEDRMDDAREHLALVFHRIVSPSRTAGGFRITINGLEVQPLDPFLEENKATQQLPVETFFVEDQPVAVAPFILPHFSKLTKGDMLIAGGEEGLRHNQGFYIYRNRRLITWGSWSKLTRQEELTKLARVRVDIPNSLDHLWTLDIKKSSATVPQVIRYNLKRIIERIVDRSRKVYTYRGQKAQSNATIHVWERQSIRNGFTYKLNRAHPLIKAIQAAIPQQHRALLQDLLAVVENTFPLELLYSEMASDLRPEPNDDTITTKQQLAATLQRLVAALSLSGEERDNFLAQIPFIEPFAGNQEATEALIRELYVQPDQREFD
jgi:hypothetical protein